MTEQHQNELRNIIATLNKSVTTPHLATFKSISKTIEKAGNAQSSSIRFKEKVFQPF